MRSKMYLVLAPVQCDAAGLHRHFAGAHRLAAVRQRRPANVSTVDSESMVTESGYNKEENTIDTQAYTSTILEQSADAGESYIDETSFWGQQHGPHVPDVRLLQL